MTVFLNKWRQRYTETVFMCQAVSQLPLLGTTGNNTSVRSWFTVIRQSRTCFAYTYLVLTFWFGWLCYTTSWPDNRPAHLYIQSIHTQYCTLKFYMFNICFLLLINIHHYMEMNKIVCGRTTIVKLTFTFLLRYSDSWIEMYALLSTLLLGGSKKLHGAAKAAINICLFHQITNSRLHQILNIS